MRSEDGKARFYVDFPSWIPESDKTGKYPLSFLWAFGKWEKSAPETLYRQPAEFHDSAVVSGAYIYDLE